MNCYSPCLNPLSDIITATVSAVKEYCMSKFICEPLSRDRVKELWFIIHNGENEKEINEAKWEWVYSFDNKLLAICLNKIDEIYCIKKLGSERMEEILDNFLNISRQVLFNKTETYDPEHTSGANLLTYAYQEIQHAFLMETNKGMTESQIKNNNKIYNAQKHYELINNKKWVQSDSSLIELSNISGLSVKVIMQTLAIKRELSKKIVSLDIYAENKTGLEASLIDNTFEREWEKMEFRRIMSNLSREEKAILYTWVDIENNYRLISEREGVFLLAGRGFNIGRGTLNSRRKALKEKIRSLMYDKDYCFAA